MKNKKMYLLLIPLVIIIALISYLIIKLSSTQAVITNLCDYNQIVAAIEAGNDVKISYDACGAKADGKTNDFYAMEKAHNIANQLYVKKGIMKTVYSCGDDDCSGKTYYIGSNKKNITDSAGLDIKVVTNVNWGNANFIIDDYIDSNNDGINDVDATKNLFNITSPVSRIQGNNFYFKYKSEVFSGLTINPQTTNLKTLVDSLYDGKILDDDGGEINETQILNVQKYFKSSQRWVIYVLDKNCEGISSTTEKEACKKEYYQYIRKGENLKDLGQIKQEMIIIDNSGNVLTDVKWTYNNISEIKVYPIPYTQISVEKGTFTTYTNNIVYTEDSVSAKPYLNRGIYVGYSGNVAIKNIKHFLNENIHPNSNKYQDISNGNKYYGFIRIYKSAFVNVNYTYLNPHTVTKIVNSNGELTGSMNGTYDLTIDDSSNILLDNISYSCTDNTCYNDKMINENRWGIMGSSNTKNIFITNSRMNRIDAHRGITNLYVSDTQVGVGAGLSSLTLTGDNYFYGKNLIIDSSNNLLKLRDDYGSTWDGTMVFNGVDFRVNANSVTPSIIRSNNDQTHYFGYTSYFPNVYIKGLNIDTQIKKATEVKSVSLLELSSLPSNNTTDSRSLYHFKGNIYLTDVTYTTKKGQTEYVPSSWKFNLFSNDFVANASKTLNINNYGGNDKVNIYLNSNVTNNVSGYINTKFDIKSENTSAVDTIDTKISETESYFSTLKEEIQMPTTSLTPVIGSLSIGGTPQNVSSTVTKYTSVVSSSTSSVVIEIDTAYTGTYIKWGSESQVGTSLNKTVNLNYGKNTFTFTVTNANNVSTTYTIEITRAHEPNIKSISINDGSTTITPSKITDTSYSATVKSGVEIVEVEVCSNYGQTQNCIGKEEELDYGDNNIPFTITNEAGESKAYNLTVTRGHPPIIKNITLSSGEKLNEEVADSRTNYTVDTFSSEVSVGVTPNTNTTISGLNSPITLNYGTNEVAFTVTNIAGESTNYTIVIKRWYDFSKIVPNDYVYNYDDNFLYTKTNRKSETILGKLNDNNVDMKLEKGLLKITNKEGESLTRKNTSGIKIVCFGIDNLEKEIEGKNIKLKEKVSYETLEDAINTTLVTWKLFDTTGKEVTSGNIDSGYQLKIYYSDNPNILLDTYEINIVINEYLEFINLNVDKENKIIKRVAPGTTYNSVINNISTNGNITIKDKNGSVLTGTSLAKTGDIIEIKMTNNTYNYTVSVLGDVTGDGMVSQADVTKLFQHYRGTISEEQKLTNAEILAGDVKEDNVIKLTDIAKLHQYANKKITSLN